MSENLGEIYVKIKADVSNLAKELDEIRRKVSKDGDEMGKKLSFKAKFDNSIALWRISELQKLREKLQKEFDKKVSIDVSSTSLDRTREKIAAVDARLKGVGESAEKTGGIFKSAFGKGLILAGGVTAFFSALKNSIQAAQESAIAQAQISQAVRTTGMAAGLTAKELFRMADELKKLTAIDDDTILTNVTNNLLTFRNVSGDVFKRAQVAILDLNAVIAKGDIGSLTSQTIQLGKALQSPSTGLMFLTRAGISFSEQQKEQIKTLEQSGNLFEAQSRILDVIEKQYGGQAKILALADGGFKKLNQSIDDVSEAIGKDLIGGANEGTGALQELADGFLGVNEAVKEVTGGVGIFGTILEGLKNVVTGGRGILDNAFNIKGLYKAAKNQYIKDMEEAAKKTKEFYNTLGLSVEPVKLTPITPQLDTTFGDEILANYQKQQTEIAQLRNKLKDVNLTTEERITLEKELTSILDKQKDKTVKTKFESQIPSGYTAQQVAEFEKLKFAAKDYADYALAVIEMKYQQELADAKGNSKAILKAEENKTLGIARLNQEMIDLQKEGSDATNKIVADSLKEREKELEIDLEKEAQVEADSYIKRQDALNKYYDALSFKDEGYLAYRIENIKKEAKIIEESTNNKLLGEQFLISETQKLWQEYSDWRIEQWQKDNKVAAAALDSMKEGFTQAFQLIKIRTKQNASALENIFVDMANSFIAQVERMIAEWAAFQLLKGIVGIIAAPFTGGASAVVAAAAHSGGEFLGTSSGIKKMAAGGSMIIPPGYPNDSYPILVESGERVSVTPAGSVGSQDRLLSEISNRLKTLEVLNKNLISKNFAPVIVANLELDGRKITKSVVSNINKMQKEGRNLSY